MNRNYVDITAACDHIIPLKNILSYFIKTHKSCVHDVWMVGCIIKQRNNLNNSMYTVDIIAFLIQGYMHPILSK